mmetsp:Transcript_60172/g.152726  ORF Transcript_60172/g.152726 Transcript_60172/m.152726 type:complete len:235 (+) Transcript_60172:94-798(+)
MRPGAAAGRTEWECFFGMPSSMAASPATPPAPLPRRLNESSNASILTSLMSPLKAGAAGRRRNAGAMYAAGSGVESYTTSFFFFFGSGVLGASASASTSQSEGASASASGAGSATGSSWSGCMGQGSETSMRSSGTSTLPSGDRHPARIGPSTSGSVVGATRAPSNDATQGAGAPSSETTGEGGWGRAEETGCLTSVRAGRGSSLTGFVSILSSCEPLALHCGTSVRYCKRGPA